MRLFAQEFIDIAGIIIHRVIAEDFTGKCAICHCPFPGINGFYMKRITRRNAFFRFSQ